MIKILNKKSSLLGAFLAGDKGFEPLLAEPESAVLPLDESPMISAGYFSTSKEVRQGRVILHELPDGHFLPYRGELRLHVEQTSGQRSKQCQVLIASDMG